MSVNLWTFLIKLTKNFSKPSQIFLQTQRNIKLAANNQNKIKTINSQVYSFK